MSGQIIELARAPRKQREAEARDRSPLPTVADRLHWRAVVRDGGLFAASRLGDRVEWHLAQCAAPHADGAHCTEGLHLIESVGQPDGHCLVNGTCARCGAPQRTTTRKAA